MKNLLLTTIAAVLLVGCGPSVSINEAARDGNIEAVKQHLDAGTDVNEKDSYGRTPLHFAARKGFKKIAALLITKGANVNEKDNRTTTPLHEAASWGHKEFVALLLANGANINVKRRSGGTPTPLDHVEGAIKQYSHRSNYSPEKIAALKETAEFLRKNGGKTSDGLKADESIYLAAKLGDIEAVQKHMNNGVDVNAKGEGRWTPLFNAVYWAIDQLPTGHKEIVELLLAKGADVNAKSELGETPLHFAKTKEIVELLIAEGADVNAKDEDGGTPLDVAEEVKDWHASEDIVVKKETADLLRKNGGKTGKELAMMPRLVQHGRFAFSFDAKEGKVYEVQDSFNLLNWEVIKTYNGTGDSVRFDEERDHDPPQWFYRVRVVE